MAPVVLSGLLVCTADAQVATVQRLLPRHIELTQAEPGCVSFAVEATDNSRVWRVHEVFVDAAAFRSHQARVSTSEWGRETAGIERRYTIEGLDDGAM